MSSALRTHGPIVIGLLEIDAAAYRATLDGRALPLSPGQLDILAHLVRNRDRVVPRDELAKAAGLQKDSSVDVALSGLRRVLPPGSLRNVRSRGWILEAAAFGG